MQVMNTFTLIVHSTLHIHNQTIIQVLFDLDRKANAIRNKHETFRILLTYISDSKEKLSDLLERRNKDKNFIFK